ncbi:bifunctional diguanylate cyclase/phosphodiesterase [Endozoicomonas sp. SM1973]|uniref:Bifunctional diguanylate cyclase/phosphodiesterase n=1 Tax=Spartinivicinus marinus TaxID=2994442 RepID=A0A853IN05_9GAMM|nr:bifunctional diguanylate cyclase/phosphodiesterase [Spartinivicinus marinus]MCX4025384.1 bifunctional diguanylate cyclase/phosphodiesterase [Spartinivicinus marinus]NYZ69196.1 bifunctional diguanylate cyclase/phosphodiesterase [Spartinivicinus marinus]
MSFDRFYDHQVKTKQASVSCNEPWVGILTAQGQWLLKNKALERELTALANGQYQPDWIELVRDLSNSGQLAQHGTSFCIPSYSSSQSGQRRLWCQLLPFQKKDSRGALVTITEQPLLVNNAADLAAWFAILDAIQDSTLLFDQSGVLLHANTVAMQLVGITSDVDKNNLYISQLFPELQLNDKEHLPQWLAGSDSGFGEGNQWREVTLLNAQNKTQLVMMTMMSLSIQGQQWVMVLLRDNAKQFLSQQKLLNYLYHDPLTGLANRALFQDRLAQGVIRARRRKRKVALLVINLSRFKVINDTLGHAAGDDLLKKVALRLGQAVREEDTIARLGSDEFAIILEDTFDQNDAAVVGQHVVEVLSVPFQLQEKEIFVSASIGISLLTSPSDNHETLLKQADIALNKAKQLGPNHYEFFSKEMKAVSEYRIQLESRLHYALANQEMVLYYQPQIDIHFGCIAGFEALLRWRHPTEGIILPGLFIPLLEETGLILPVSEWLLETACIQHRAWISDGKVPPYTSIAVNLPTRLLLSGSLLSVLDKALHNSQLPPQLLELEITESMLMHDINFAIKELNQVKARGVSISIDDFGTGYSSLSYLKQLPIDTLKIDRMFVEDIPDDQDAASIARAIINLAHNLKLQVIAEGVENEKALGFLQAEGCDICQGYLFAPALPAEQLLEKYEQLTETAYMESTLAPHSVTH